MVTNEAWICHHEWPAIGWPLLAGKDVSPNTHAHSHTHCNCSATILYFYFHYICFTFWSSELAMTTRGENSFALGFTLNAMQTFIRVRLFQIIILPTTMCTHTKHFRGCTDENIAVSEGDAISFWAGGSIHSQILWQSGDVSARKATQGRCIRRPEEPGNWSTCIGLDLAKGRAGHTGRRCERRARQSWAWGMASYRTSLEITNVFLRCKVSLYPTITMPCLCTAPPPPAPAPHFWLRRSAWGGLSRIAFFSPQQWLLPH